VTLPRSRRLSLSALAIGTAVLLAACGSKAPATTTDTPGPPDDGPTASAAPIVLPSAAKRFTVTSTAFADGKPIPQKYTCNGDGSLPPLSWSGDLNGGKYVAIVVDDPDAPDGGYVHWFVTDLSTKPAPLNPDELPDGSHAASNSDGDPSWTPPCPDKGTHHYRFTVYSLDGPSGVSDGDDPARALQEISPHIKAYGQLTGTVTAA
jgi:Raf kinase inhibitor-like YbhB/YbcL family protein